MRGRWGVAILLSLAVVVAGVLAGTGGASRGPVEGASRSGAIVAPPAAGAGRDTPAPSGDPTATARVPASTGVAPARGVPVLYYHRIDALPASAHGWSHARIDRFLAYDVVPAAFAAQLDWLVAHGYRTILPRDLTAHWTKGTPLPPRPVIITFDDGTPDWITTVLPDLRRHHMVAEFYVTLDAIRVGAISWRDVRTLRDANMGIGGHDVHHVQLAALGHGRPDAPVSVMTREVGDIRGVMRQKIGQVPDSMAYVGGGFDARLIRVVEQAGYTSARTTRVGITTSSAQRFVLPAVHVSSDEDVVDRWTQQLVPGLPAFARSLVHGR